MKTTRNILLKVTGSIAAYKAAYLASRLVQAGYSVKTVFSKSAREFVGAITFEGLTREKVYESTYEEGRAMAHIDLARWADLTLVYPATASTINKLSVGEGSDLIGTLFLAHDFESPYWIAPAMNPSMLAHPVTQDAIVKLRGFGVQVLESGEGRMACGEEGEGRLIEPEVMFERIERHFKAEKPRKILITAGGTSEPIDSVRSITNLSTGETGVRLAQALATRGHEVTLLLSDQSRVEFKNLEPIRFSSCEDLQKKVHAELKCESYDFAIHAAAVSDFAVDSITDENGEPIVTGGKIPSDRNIRLNLKRNPKIVATMKKVSKNQEMKLVSFKLTVGTDRFDTGAYSTSDLIVQNESSRIERGTDRHAGVIYAKTIPGSDTFKKVHVFRSKSDLFALLQEFIEEAPSKSGAKARLASVFNVRHFPEVQP